MGKDNFLYGLFIAEEVVLGGSEWVVGHRVTEPLDIRKMGD